MAQSLDQCGFRFTWRIENFSMCPLETGDCIDSPIFVADELNKTEWYIRLYPKGMRSSDGGRVACFLITANSGDQEPVNIFYDIKLIKLNTKSYPISANKHPGGKFSGHGFKTLITLQKLSENKDTFLPNDVLSVLCFMWKGTEQLENSREKFYISSSLVNNTYSLEEISTFISDVEISTEQHHDTCIVTTRIPVERSEIRWIIKDFKTQMITVKKIPISVVTKTREKSALLLHCTLSGDWDRDGIIRIDIQRKDKHFHPMLLKCKVSVLDKHGTAQEYLEDQHMFGVNYEVWSFPLVLKVETIKNRESELLNDGALTLQCEFLISFKGQAVTINDDDLHAINHDIVSGDLLTDIIDMEEDEKLADVTLISEGLELPVHKFVICARSSVFKAMFTNDTEEKRTGVVQINDIEADTLMNLKSFMYGNDLPDLQPEQAAKLYLAADKYDILVLKNWCASSLKYALSVSNVCEVLVLADLHKDENLLKFVHAFLEVHSLDVLESAEWANLMENNVMLAANTMKKLILTLASSLSRFFPWLSASV